MQVEEVKVGMDVELDFLDIGKEQVARSIRIQACLRMKKEGLL
jgi:hypothetical protein